MDAARCSLPRVLPLLVVPALDFLRLGFPCSWSPPGSPRWSRVRLLGSRPACLGLQGLIILEADLVVARPGLRSVQLPSLATLLGPHDESVVHIDPGSIDRMSSEVRGGVMGTAVVFRDVVDEVPGVERLLMEREAGDDTAGRHGAGHRQRVGANLLRPRRVGERNRRRGDIWI